MEDRTYGFVERDPLTRSLLQERQNRESSALWQCKCDIS